MQDETVVSLSHVSKVLGKREVVSDLSLAVGPGQCFGLIGPSGGGKTSAIRLMVGIYAPTFGEVRVFGSDPTRLSIPQRERIGYMPQHFFLHPTLTAKENLSYVAGIYGLGWWHRRRLIPQLLKKMELWDARDRLAADLSGGMLRRLQLAAVIMHEPALVFVDEPMAGLDPLLRDRIWDLLRELCERGSTVIITTQITQEAERCDCIALLKDGKVAALGTAAELRRRALGGEAARVLVGERAHEAMAILWAAPGISEVSRIDGNAIRVISSDDGRSISEAVAALRHRGIAVQAVEATEPSFDEVFERLVGRA